MEYELSQTESFTKWYKKLRDRQATKAIALRLTRAQAGNLGDCEPVGEGISEMRIFVGKGYRVYFKVEDCSLVVTNLLNKKTSTLLSRLPRILNSGGSKR